MMAANPIFLAGAFLFEGGGVAWAAWELWKLRPGKDGKGEQTSAFARKPKPDDSPEAPGHTKGEHRSDDG